MDPYDVSASECLRVLLTEQARSLRIAAQRVDSLCSSGAQAVQPAQWAGPARIAHDELAQRLLTHLAAAGNAIRDAADESAHAVATLASRVG